MLVRDCDHTPAQVVGEGITIRWLIGQPEVAPTFAMRVVEFAPGAVFPWHEHAYEHEIFVLEGEGIAEGPDGSVPMRAGSALYVPPDERHGYRNTGRGPLRFICVIPHPQS